MSAPRELVLSASLPTHTLKVYSKEYCRTTISSSAVPRVSSTDLLKGKAQAHSTLCLELPGGKQLEPLPDETAFWGTPVYFSQEGDRRERELCLLQRQQRKSRKSQQKELKEREAIEAEIEEHEVEKDYKLYLEYATKFGGLNGTLYASR